MLVPQRMTTRWHLLLFEKDSLVPKTTLKFPHVPPSIPPIPSELFICSRTLLCCSFLSYHRLWRTSPLKWSHLELLLWVTYAIVLKEDNSRNTLMVVSDPSKYSLSSGNCQVTCQEFLSQSPVTKSSTTQLDRDYCSVLQTKSLKLNGTEKLAGKIV